MKHIIGIGLLLLSIAAMGKEITYVVETAVVKPQAEFAIVRRYIGTIKAEKFSLLRPKITGTIAAILVKPNQKVKKGELLVTLTSNVEKRSLELAKKSLQLSTQALERSRSLFKSHDVTKSKLEEAERDVLNAKAKVEEEKRVVENVELRAPFDGVVGIPRVVMGESVQLDTPVISISDGPLSVFINIPASRLAEVKTGQAAKIKTLNANIAAVEKSIDPKTRTGFATATLPPCDSCIVGDSVFVNINVVDKKNVILISKNAVYYQNQKPKVVVVKSEEDKHRAEIREIVVGEEQEGVVEVLSGLKEGEEIVIVNPKRIPPQANLSVLK